MNNNIFRCRVCGRFAIYEELDLHECRSLKKYDIDDEILRVFDGIFWYPLKRQSIARRFLTGIKSDKDFTAPEHKSI